MNDEGISENASTQGISKENDSYWYAAALDIWDKAPMLIKAAVTNFAPALGKVAQHRTSSQEVDTVSTVLDLMEKGKKCTAEEATTHWKNLGSKATNIIGYETQCKEAMCNESAEGPKIVKAGLQQSIQSAANDILFISCAAGSIQLILQACTLWKLMEAIKCAENKIKLTADQRKSIESKLTKIRQDLGELDPFLKKLEQPNLQTRDVLLINNQIQIIINKLSLEIDKALSEIATLHEDLAGLVNKVKEARNMAISSTVGGFVSGVSGALNCNTLSAFASPVALGVTSVIAASNIIVGFLQLRNGVFQITLLRNLKLKLLKSKN